MITKKFWIIALLLIGSLVVSACQYVDADPALYMDLEGDDHTLLYESDPGLTYQFDFTADMVLDIPDSYFEMDATGSGGVVYDDMGEPTAMQIVFNGVATMDDDTEPIMLEVRMIDDMMYMRAEAAESGEDTGWAAVSLGSALADMDLGMDMGDESAMGVLNQAEVGEYAEISRAADEGNLAHFIIEVDFLELLASPQFMAALDLGDLTEGADTGMDMELTPELLQMVFGMLIPEFGVTVDQYVDLESGYQSRSVTDFAFAFDASMLTMMLGEGDTGGMEIPEAIEVSLYMDTSYRDFGSDFMIEVPEDAEEMELNDFSGSLDELSIE